MQLPERSFRKCEWDLVRQIQCPTASLVLCFAITVTYFLVRPRGPAPSL
jgi:hypothetical protein